MKIYDVVKTGAQAVSIAANSYRLVTVPMAHEGRIGTIIVKQVAVADGGGTAVPFTVDFLKSKMSLLPDTDIANATTLPSNLPIYRVCDTKSGSAGAVVSEFTPAVGGDGYLFRNVDGTQTEPHRKAYILIRPTSSGTTTKWEYSVVSVSEGAG